MTDYVKIKNDKMAFSFGGGGFFWNQKQETPAREQTSELLPTV